MYKFDVSYDSYSSLTSFLLKNIYKKMSRVSVKYQAQAVQD